MKKKCNKKDDRKFTRKAQGNVQKNEMKVFFCFPHNTNSWGGGGGGLEYKKKVGMLVENFEIDP